MLGLPKFLFHLCFSFVLIPFLTNAQQYSKYTAEQLHYIDSLEKLISEKTNADTAKAIQLNKLAWLYRTKENDKALRHLKEALIIAENNNALHIKASTYNQMGVIYQIKADYRKALWYHLNALKIYRNLNTSDTIEVCFNLGSIYLYLGKYEIAKQFILLGKKPNARGVTLTDWYCNMGVVEYQLGHVKESVQYYKKAIAEINRSGEFQNAALVYINLSEVYIAQNNTIEARKCCLKALAYSKNDPYFEIGAHQMMGKIFLLEKKFIEAEFHLMKAKNMAQQSGIQITLPDIIKDIANMYEKKGEYKKSLEFYKTASVLKDSNLNQTFTKQLSEMQASFDTERKNEEIEKLNQLSLQRSEQEKLRQYLWLIVLTFILTICGVLLRNILVSRKFATQLQRKNGQLEVSNLALNESKIKIQVQKQKIEEINLILSQNNRDLTDENILAKYEILKSKTNPHFLFNSLASLSAIVKDNETASEFLERFIDLYRQVLETSEQKLVTLKEEMEVVNNYLYLEKVRFEEQIQIESLIMPETLSLFIPPFALQLVVENILKHNIATEKKKLHIHLYTDHDKIIVRNNLQKKTSGVESTHIGHRNIIERYQILSNLVPVMIETMNEYIVELPLLKNHKLH